jgi:hypothetical protein
MPLLCCSCAAPGDDRALYLLEATGQRYCLSCLGHKLDDLLGATLPQLPAQASLPLSSAVRSEELKRLASKAAAPSLESARQLVTHTLTQPGASLSCPCCEQRVQAYRRRVHRSMALFLVAMTRRWAAWTGATREDWAKQPRGPYIHRNDVAHTANDYPYLRMFGALGAPLDERGWPLEGLTEALEGEPGKVKPGWWRPTPTALAWMRGEVLIPAWLEVYNGGVMARADEGLTLQEALAEPFCLEDVLGAAHQAARRA